VLPMTDVAHIQSASDSTSPCGAELLWPLPGGTASPRFCSPRP
jgi:hypothetical protein